MATITIDGKNYDTDTLSTEAKNTINALQFTEIEIQRGQARLAALQTARNVYLSALKTQIDKSPAKEENKFQFSSETIKF